MGKIRRIGILGGTFNPPHLGHLILAQESLCKLKLDRVIFIPTYLPPHKKVKGNGAYARYKMTVLACKGNPKLEVSKIEIDKKSVSYSVETLRKLRKKYGKAAKLYFITGSDSLKEIENWREVDEILRLSSFIVAARPGFPFVKTKRKVKLIDMPPIDISSSMIRDRVRNSKPIMYLVPDPVREFIKKNRLYR